MAERCLHCDAPLAGAYCSACGQRAATGRLSLREALEQAVQGFTALDRAWPATVVGLARDPGGTAARYVEGHRVAYVTPVRWAAWMVGLYVVAMNLLELEPVTITTTGASAEEAAAAKGLALDAVRSSWSLATLFAIPIVALLQRSLFRRSGRNWAECTAFLLLLTGELYLFSLLLLPLAATEPKLDFAVRGLLALAYFTWGAARFHGERMPLALLKTAALGIASVLAMLPVILIGLYPLIRSMSAD